MEKNNKEYKAVEDLIAKLDGQLETNKLYSKQFNDSVTQSKLDIEDHFNQCIQALTARRDILLNEHSQKILERNKTFEESNLRLHNGIATCRKVLESGSLIFENDAVVAEKIWKSVKKIKIAPVPETKLSASLPLEIIKLIQEWQVQWHELPSADESKTECQDGKETEAQFNDPRGPSNATAEDMWQKLRDSVSDLPRISTSPKMTNSAQVHGTDSIQKLFLTPDMVSTFVGSEKGKKDGKGTKALFNEPRGICWNPLQNCFYVSDSQNNSIRIFTLEGDVSTFLCSEKLKYPGRIVMNYKDNCFYTISCVKSKEAIIKITSSVSVGEVSVLAGGVKEGFDDGIGSNASFNNILSIAIQQQHGNMFICDCDNHAIRMISPQGEVTTIAGSQTKGFADGKGKSAQFNSPAGIFFDEVDQTLFVCDYGNNRIRRVTLNVTKNEGEVTTLCECAWPSQIVQTQNRSIFVSSFVGNKIFRITKDGTGKYEAQLMAGSGKRERVDGKPKECSFNSPYSMAVHEPSNSLFVCEESDSIRKISFI